MGVGALFGNPLLSALRISEAQLQLHSIPVRSGKRMSPEQPVLGRELSSPYSMDSHALRR